MTSLSHNIRLAKISDANQIAKCHVASWQKIYRGHIPDAVLDALSVEERQQKWQDLLENNIRILVLERDHQVIGFASLCPSRDEDTNPKQCGEISALYLHPDFWHQGLGKKLCTAALIELEKMGFNKVTLWVLKENDQARQFYEAMGFSETGHTKQDHYDQEIILNEVRYQKILSRNSALSH